MVYPEVEKSQIDGDITCSNMIAGVTTCTVSIFSEDDHNVSLTLTNDVGSTQPVVGMFNREWIMY